MTIYANLQRRREAYGIVNESPTYRAARQFHAHEVYRMFRVPFRLFEPAPWKANAHRYGR